MNRVRIRFETLSQYKCFEVLLSALDALSTLTSLQGLCEAAVEWAPWRAVSRRDRAAVLSVAYATCFDLLSFPSPSLPQLETLGAAGQGLSRRVLPPVLGAPAERGLISSTLRVAASRLSLHRLL